jgi:hypothetical protein
MINLIHIIAFSALTVFVLLKMTKVINWPWIGVLAPLLFLGVIDAGDAVRYALGFTDHPPSYWQVWFLWAIVWAIVGFAAGWVIVHVVAYCIQALLWAAGTITQALKRLMRLEPR